MAKADKYLVSVDCVMVSPTRGGHHVGIALICHDCDRIVNTWTDLPIPFSSLASDMARHDETRCKERKR